MPGTRKSHFWSDEEKRSICAQTTTPGVSVAQVARQYSMNCNLIYNWLTDTLFAPREDAAQPEDGAMAFLPVEFGDPLFAGCTQSSSGASSPLPFGHTAGDLPVCHVNGGVKTYHAAAQKQTTVIGFRLNKSF